MDQSFLHEYSIGIVAENKALGSTKILVTPYEKTQLVDGDLKSNPTKVTSQGKDAQGTNYTVNATMDNVIEAEWLRGTSTNRRTAPDVRRGERVRIYRYADTDQFYWQPMGLDDHLRKGETVIYSFSGTKDEKEDSTKPENSWYMEVSTHNGAATFQTSKKNGEKFGYTIQVDAKNGRVLIQDDVGNSIELDSINTVLLLVNKDQTSVELNKKDINIYAPDNLNIETGKSVNIKTKNITVEAETITVKATTTNITSVVNVTGDTSITGGFTVTGVTTFGDGATINGNVQVNGTIHCNQLTSDQNISAPNV